MVRHRHSQELLDLSSATCDAQLDAESFAQLEALLSESDEACESWLTYMQLDADLRVLVATSSAERQALARLSVTGGPALVVEPPTLPGLESDPGGILGVFQKPVDWLMRPSSFTILIVSVMGLPLLGLLWVLTVSEPKVADQPPVPRILAQSERQADNAEWLAPGDRISLVRPPQEVATLFSATKDAVWSGGENYRVGQLLAEGTRLNLLAGSAQISMTCGADVVLQSPCAVVLLEDRLVQLEAGKLTAQVAKWATGFVVETRGLQITDMGTRFAVSAESPGAPEAHVLIGSVLAKPLWPGHPHEDSLLLRSNDAIRVNTRQGKVDRFAAERGRFAEKFDNVRPYRPIELPNTGRGLMIDDEDPLWRITAGPSSVGPWPRPAIVSLPHVRYSDNAPEKSQWISVQGGVKRGVPCNTVYTFETTFDLTGSNPATVSVIAQILADNTVTGIRLNGKPVPMQPWVDNILNNQRFHIFHVVEIRDGFVEGENRLEIDVFNGIFTARSSRPDPMALRVEWQAFGCSH